MVVAASTGAAAGRLSLFAGLSGASAFVILLLQLFATASLALLQSGSCNAAQLICRCRDAACACWACQQAWGPALQSQQLCWQPWQCGHQLC